MDIILNDQLLYQVQSKYLHKKVLDQHKIIDEDF